MILFGATACDDDYEQRAFVVQGTTMAPALQPGDIIDVEVGREPERFDLVAYEKFWSDGKPVIGRAIGLPGEEIRVLGDELVIDGTAYTDPYGDGATYDVTFALGDDEYVVLQDARDEGDDSHIRGPVRREYVIGSVRHNAD